MGICSHRKQAYFVLWGKLYESLREHAKNINDFPKKKKMIQLTKGELKLHQAAKCVTFVEKFFWDSYLKVQIIRKLKIIAIILVNIEAQHIVFHIGSSYDYHFIIKELANDF